MAKCHKFEYCCGNFEFSSSINKGATIRLPGGGGGGGRAGLKKQSGPGFGKTKILALTMCDKNILTSSIEKNVCLLSMKRKCLLLCMKRKCLPSIYDSIMDREQI